MAEALTAARAARAAFDRALGLVGVGLEDGMLDEQEAGRLIAWMTRAALAEAESLRATAGRRDEAGIAAAKAAHARSLAEAREALRRNDLDAIRPSVAAAATALGVDASAAAADPALLREALRRRAAVAEANIAREDGVYAEDRALLHAALATPGAPCRAGQPAADSPEPPAPGLDAPAATGGAGAQAVRPVGEAACSVPAPRALAALSALTGRPAAGEGGAGPAPTDAGRPRSGQPPGIAGRPAAPVAVIAGPRVMLEDAVAAAIRYAASPDMRNHARAHGGLLLAHVSNRPLDEIGPDQLLGFLLWCRRLPREHGRRHGINRHTPDKDRARAGQPRKDEEIAAADAADAQAGLFVDALAVSDREKAACLAELLTPRLTEKTLKNIHAGVIRIFKAAALHLGWCGPVPHSVMERFRAHAAAAAAEERARGAEIVVIERRRRSWSQERITALLDSPLYRGGFSAKRRWRPGAVIVRDALYWVPLIILCMGLRPREAVQLYKTDIIRRDGIAAIAIRDGGVKTVKRLASRRVVPVHPLLLALGFSDWVETQRDRPGLHLFPEITDTVAPDANPADRFGERFTQIRIGLGILDAEEDFYALRRTFSSRLQSAGVQDSDRAALLGHVQKDVTNLHYTDREISRLAALVARIDHGTCVAMSESHGFPVIAGVRPPGPPSIEVDLALDANGFPVRVCVDPGVDGAPEISTAIRPLPSWDPAAVRIADDGLPARDVAAALQRRIGGARAVARDPRAQNMLEYLLSIAAPSAAAP